MQETGKVIETEGNMAKVEVVQKEVCHKCPSESFCRLATEGSRTIEVLNGMGAKAGQLVKIEISSGSILAGAFFVYIFPILALLIAGSLAQWISSNQNMAIIAGISALVASFLFVYFFDKKIAQSKKIIPVIKEIVSSG